MTDNVIEMRKLQRSGGRTIINPKGSMTHEKCEELEAKFEESINNGKVDIIMDCKTVPFIDSEGLEFILKMHETLKQKGGKLKISGMNKVCRDILLATRLITVLHIYDEMQKAITDGA